MAVDGKAEAAEPEEPSTEEILASIRRIITEDETPDDGAASAVGAAAPTPGPIVARLAGIQRDIGPMAGRSVQRERPLLAPGRSIAAAGAFARLPGAEPTRPGGERSVEDVARDLLRPMLKQWLDENLPGMVERLVQREIERVSGG